MESNIKKNRRQFNLQEEYFVRTLNLLWADPKCRISALRPSSRTRWTLTPTSLSRATATRSAGDCQAHNDERVIMPFFFCCTFVTMFITQYLQ